MLTRILVPLDGSSTSESILPHVEFLLASEDADVTLAVVTADGSPRQEKAARAYLAGVAARLRRKGAVVDTAALAGDAAEAILAHANRNRYSMIMMTSRAKSGLRRLIFGSTAESVLSQSPVPVFVAHPRDRNAGPIRVQSVVVPLDGSHRSASILKALAPFAKAIVAKLVFTTVVSPVKKDTLPVDLVARNLAEAQKDMVAQGIPTELVIRYGDPATEILAVAADRADSMIALSTHGRSGLDRVRFGSVAAKLLRHGSGPMLVLRTAAIPKTKGTTPAALRARRRTMESFKRAVKGQKGAFTT